MRLAIWPLKPPPENCTYVSISLFPHLQILGVGQKSSHPAEYLKVVNVPITSSRVTCLVLLPRGNVSRQLQSRKAESRCSLRLFPKLLHLFSVGMVLDIRPKDSVPPREGGGVIPNEVHVVEIVMPSTGIKRDVVQWVERDIITTVHIDGF